MTWQKALYLGIFFFLLAVFSLQLYPLSQEEISLLSTKSKEQLIQIILLYDQDSIAQEAEYQNLKDNLKQKENFLNMREDFLDQRQTALAELTQAVLDVKSSYEIFYTETKKKRTLERILDWLGGFATGYGTNEIKQLF